MFGLDDVALGMGISSLVGGIFGSAGQASANRQNVELARQQNAWQEIQNQKAMEFSAAQAKQQMEFQSAQSSTAYQRAVKDMQQAGLNPMLAYTQGGASAGAGAAGSGFTSSGVTPRVESVAGPAISSAANAVNTMQAVQQMAQSKAATEQIMAQTKKVESETMERSANAAKLIAEIKNIGATTSLTSASADNVQQQILGTISDSATKHAVFQEMNKQGGFAADVAKRKAESVLTQMEIPKAKVESEFFKPGNFGELNPYLRSVIEILRGLNSARSLGR